MQKCEKCGAEWDTVKILEVCPFCGMALSNDISPNDIKSIEDAFKYVIKSYGIEIIKNRRRFVSLLSDYAPDFEKKRRLVNVALESGVYDSLAEHKDTRIEEFNNEFIKGKCILVESYYIEEKSSFQVLAWLAGSIRNDFVMRINDRSNNKSEDDVAENKSENDVTEIKSENDVAELWEMYYKGEGTPQNYAKAMEWLQKAAEQGNADAQFRLGAMYEKGEGVPQDYAKAMEWYQKAAEQGDANAQLGLGAMYHDGEGVAQNYAKAMEWFQKAAEQGNADAQLSLGDMYRDGEGVAQNYAKAMEWLQKAAEQGDADAQFRLGAMYEKGEGVTQDYAKAVECHQKAAEQGNAGAQFRLGVMYEKGEGVAQDYAKAMEWYQKAAEQGNANAQFNLEALNYGAPAVKTAQIPNRAVNYSQNIGTKAVNTNTEIYEPKGAIRTIMWIIAVYFFLGGISVFAGGQVAYGIACVIVGLIMCPKTNKYMRFMPRLGLALLVIIVFSTMYNV